MRSNGQKLGITKVVQDCRDNFVQVSFVCDSHNSGLSQTEIALVPR